MKSVVRIALLLILPCIASFAFQEEGKNYWEESYSDDSLDDISLHDDDDDIIERELDSLVIRRRGTFDCKQKQGECSGIIPCCGTLQCYWPDGYSALKSGRCVDCVQQGQKCQRDTQCCSSLACHKGSSYYVDGSCGVKRYTGGECHDNDQCHSGKCNIGWRDKIKGYGGKCT